MLQNVYLNVLSGPPTFTRPPLAVVKVAEGQSVNLTCRVFGAPRPVITWRKEGDIIQDSNRFKTLKVGDLQILVGGRC